MTSLNDLVEKNKDLINKANEAIVASAFHSVKDIYIDLPLLKDTRMGLLINLAKTEEEVAYLVNGLAKYNTRPNRHFTTVYPDLKYSEEDLVKFYENPNNSDQIFNRSPDTDFSCNLEALFKSICSENARAGIAHRINVTINTYPLVVKTNLTAYLQILRYAFGKFATFKFITTDVRKMDSETWKSFDMLFIDNLSAALDKNGVLKDLLFQDMKFTNKTVFAPYACDDDIFAKWKQYNIDVTDPETAKDMFKISEYLIGTYCYFKFMPFQIPLPKE